MRRDIGDKKYKTSQGETFNETISALAGYRTVQSEIENQSFV